MENQLKKDGFYEQKLYVIPEYRMKELAQDELTKYLFISDIGIFPKAQFHFRERLDGSEAHIFIYCTEGEGWAQLCDQERIPITPHQLIVIPAGTPHRYGASAHAPWSIYWFHLHGEHVVPLIQMYRLDEGPIHISSNTKFMDDFKLCYDLISNKTYSKPIQVHVSHIIQHLISRIGMYHAGASQDPKKERYMESAIQYMNDCISDSLKLSDLAKHTGLSRQHLIYLFNKETGHPPVDFFLRLKMQKAGQMLILTDLTIKEISLTLGILDPYYFSRLFKKMMGASPAEYRKLPKG